MLIYTIVMFTFIAFCIIMVETQPERPNMARQKLELEKEFWRNFGQHKPNWQAQTKDLI